MLARIFILFTLITALWLLTPIYLNSSVNSELEEDMVKHPEKYIKIHKYGFYVAARVAIIHHIQIENTADIPYKNIKVKLYYYSTSINPGQLLSSTSGILPIEIPPNSNDMYLRGGTTLGAGSLAYDARNIKVLSAVPVLE